MRVTFLAHSGFLVETEQWLLLFDWWQGTLPPLPDKPLAVFVSHRHEDHFSPRIFSLNDPSRDVTFILSRDIKLSAFNRSRWNLSAETAARCRSLGGGETLSLPGLDVETLRSTDEGVAFVAVCGGKTLYHAGDLNWWHWSGEENAWNRNMECNFKRYVETLRGRHIDLAMVPLDPRQQDAEDWGLLYLLGLAQIERVLPMHQWEDYSPTARLIARRPELAGTVLEVSENGQVFTIE